ncbi:hypothetical protein D3C87_1305730 [compost metagenome]
MQRTGLGRFEAIQLDWRTLEVDRLTPINLSATACSFVQQHRANAVRDQGLRRANAGRSGADDDDGFHAHLGCCAFAGAGLLANTATQAAEMLAGRPLSRASALPQGIRFL